MCYEWKHSNKVRGGLEQQCIPAYRVAGSPGNDFRVEFKAVGDTVNLASRLEGTTKFYSCPIVICAETRANLHDRLSLDGGYRTGPGVSR